MGWREDAGLESDMLTNTTLAAIPDVKTLAKSYVDAQQHIGGSIRVPSEDAGKEDWDKFNAKILSKTTTLIPKPDLENEDNVAQLLGLLGMPKDADGYDFTGVNVDDFKVPEGMVTNLQKMAHGAGMTNAQAKKFALATMMDQHAINTASSEKLNIGRTELMKEWGLAFDQKSKDAVSILKKTGAPEELIKAAENGEVAAGTLKWANALASAFGGEGTPFGDQGGNHQGSDLLSPADAKAKIGDIMGNKEHAYWVGRNPGHKAAVDKMVELHRMANAKQ